MQVPARMFNRFATMFDQRERFAKGEAVRGRSGSLRPTLAPFIHVESI